MDLQFAKVPEASPIERLAEFRTRASNSAEVQLGWGSNSDANKLVHTTGHDKDNLEKL